MFQTCPECAGTLIVRLVPDWRERVRKGEPVPIVGCGNPWHYLGLRDPAELGEYGLPNAPEQEP